jgi:hypothetical protein
MALAIGTPGPSGNLDASSKAQRVAIRGVNETKEVWTICRVLDSDAGVVALMAVQETRQARTA